MDSNHLLDVLQTPDLPFAHVAMVLPVGVEPTLAVLQAAALPLELQKQLVLLERIELSSTA